MVPPTHEVTQLLQDWRNGDEAALSHLISLVEADLHRLAEGYMRREPADHTLQPTALINEAWLRLIDWKPGEWRNRSQFFGVVAQVMRRVLVDHARRRRALKHGGDALKVSLAEAEQWPSDSSADVIALNDALDTLASFDERKSRIVELRFFGGMTEEETAETMDIPLRTLQREWSLARAWLYNELKKKFSVFSFQPETEN
ncbi:MAG: sigma-70 family RNA polymerase sigma factor [Blastocatellales bacterium]